MRGSRRNGTAAVAFASLSGDKMLAVLAQKYDTQAKAASRRLRADSTES